MSVELQFYLLFPFLLVYLNRAPLKTTLSIIGTALIFRVIEIAAWANPRDMSYYHLIGRIDQFALGMFAATLFLGWNGREKLFRLVFCSTSLSAVLLLWAFQSLGGGFDSEANWKILWPTVEGCAWAGVVLGYTGMRQKFTAPVSKLLAMVGEMSFSIYLLHVMLLNVFAWRPWAKLRLTGQWDIDALLTTVLFALPVTLAVSAVTYRVIERPFLSLRRRYIEPEVAGTRKAEWRQAPGDIARTLLGSQPVVTAESAAASAEAAWSSSHAPGVEGSPT